MRHCYSVFAYVMISFIFSIALFILLVFGYDISKLRVEIPEQ